MTTLIRSVHTTLLAIGMLYSVDSVSQKLQWHPVEPQTDASFRALSVVDDSVAWVAGSKGWVGRTSDGGRTWSFQQVPGFETFDFRSLYAFNEREAVIANAGAPANILITHDGGQRWHVVYTHADTAAFFDGIDFWNDNSGIIYGDPLQGKMLLLLTDDGGQSWKPVPSTHTPELNAGEASFAASGTNIRCMDRHTVVIATGGATSRLWISRDRGLSWKNITPPVIHGPSSTGIFSFSGFKGKRGVIVGGDYLRDTLAIDHVFYTEDAGKSWRAPAVPTRGYRECVEFLDNDLLITTGPGGTDLSSDSGRNWTPVSDEKLFHVVRKARKGKLIVIAGGRGKISVLTVQ